MKQNIKNEHGYALLIVILLVVLIMGFFTSFMVFTLNNAKQEQTVDQQNLATIAAEMGVEYYNNKIVNNYIQEVVDTDLKNWCQDKVDIYTCIEGKIQEILLGLELNPDFSDFNMGYDFQLIAQPEIIESTQEHVVINGIVSGFKIDTPQINKKLTFQVNFPLPKIMTNDENDYNNNNPGLGELVIPLPNVEQPDTPLPSIPSIDCENLRGGVDLKNGECKAPSLNANDLKLNKFNLRIMDNINVLYSPFKISNNSHLFVGESIVRAQSPEINNESTVSVMKDMDALYSIDVNNDSTLYVNKTLRSTDSSFINNNSTVFVGDKFIGNHNLQVNNDSILYVTNDVAGIGNSDINQSTLFVGGNFDIKYDLKINDSTLLVRGKVAEVTNSHINNHSTLYVMGDFKAKNGVKVNNNSKFNVHGNLGDVDNPDINNRSILFVGGDFLARNDLKVNNRSALYVVGNLKKLSNPEINNRSSVFVGKDFEMEHVLKVNQSNLFVGGNLLNNSHLDIKNNSNLCVAGTITYKWNFNVDSSSNVYILNDVHYNIKGGGKVIKVDSIEELKEKCDVNLGNPGDSDREDNPIIEWDDSHQPTIDVWYD